HRPFAGAAWLPGLASGVEGILSSLSAPPELGSPERGSRSSPFSGLAKNQSRTVVPVHGSLVPGFEEAPAGWGRGIQGERRATSSSLHAAGAIVKTGTWFSVSSRPTRRVVRTEVWARGGLTTVIRKPAMSPFGDRSLDGG